jgi:hypothetical protein
MMYSLFLTTKAMENQPAQTPASDTADLPRRRNLINVSADSMLPLHDFSLAEFAK